MKNDSRFRILFAGTPEFSVPALQRLINEGLPPAAVLTQPDRPAGRGKKLTASPVKQFAENHELPVWQPATLRDAEVVAKIEAARPTLLVVAAYGLLLPKAVLDIPAAGCVNIHASLLPRWRGAAPIQQAILHGDAETGISLMRMDEGLDTGPVYAMSKIRIGAEETAGELHDRLATLGGELLVAKLPEILSGTIEAQAQDDAGATYAGKIRKRDASINWSSSAQEIGRKIRAYNPVPGANFQCGKEVVKCLKAHEIEAGNDSAGTVIAAGKDGIDVACGDGVLRILEVQRPGRRPVTAGEFSAQVNPAGKRLGWLS